MWLIMVLKLIDKWFAWGKVGGTKCTGIISMTVMHQSIIIFSCTYAPAPTPPPPGISFFCPGWQILGGGDSWIVTYPMACPNVMQLVFKSPVGHSTYMFTVGCNCWPTSLISRLVLPKRASNISGFIAQLVRALHQYHKVTGSNPVEVLRVQRKSVLQPAIRASCR